MGEVSSPHTSSWSRSRPSSGIQEERKRTALRARRSQECRCAAADWTAGHRALGPGIGRSAVASQATEMGVDAAIRWPFVGTGGQIRPEVDRRLDDAIVRPADMTSARTSSTGRRPKLDASLRIRLTQLERDQLAALADDDCSTLSQMARRLIVRQLRASGMSHGSAA
jgi:hypothetical protein